MAQKYRRIKVSGKQRRNIDPALMAQIIIALGKQMWEEQEANRPGDSSTLHRNSKRNRRAS